MPVKIQYALEADIAKRLFCLVWLSDSILGHFMTQVEQKGWSCGPENGTVAVLQGLLTCMVLVFRIEIGTQCAHCIAPTLDHRAVFTAWILLIARFETHSPARQPAFWFVCLLCTVAFKLITDPLGFRSALAVDLELCKLAALSLRMFKLGFESGSLCTTANQG